VAQSVTRGELLCNNTFLKDTFPCVAATTMSARLGRKQQVCDELNGQIVHTRSAGKQNSLGGANKLQGGRIV
jgi:hypothetical protein